MPVLSLAEHYWSYLLSIAPSWATLLGVHDHDAGLEDISSEAEQAHRKQFAAMLSQLEDLHPADQSERVTADMLAAELDTRRCAVRGRHHR